MTWSTKKLGEVLSGVVVWLNANEGLAQWITALVAVVALIYAIKEFFLKRRPFIDIEIQVAENPNKEQGGWLFFALLINKGTYPGTVKVEKTVMRVGDEEYPSEIKNKIFVSPGKSKKTPLIGSIYKKGIQKIKGHEYRLNRAEIEIEIKSGELGSDKLKYVTKCVYQVDVSDEQPLITLIEEYYT